MVHTVRNIPDIMMSLNEWMQDQRILLCTTWQYLTEYDQIQLTTWKVFSFISQDFLITASQLPWTLVPHCNDGVLFSETCIGKVTRKMCNRRHSENDTKRQNKIVSLICKIKTYLSSAFTPYSRPDCWIFSAFGNVHLYPRFSKGGEGTEGIPPSWHSLETAVKFHNRT